MSIYTKTIQDLNKQGVSLRELAKRFCLSLSTVYQIVQNGERKNRAIRCPDCGALLNELPCRACQIKKRLKQNSLPGREYYQEYYSDQPRCRTSGRKRKQQIKYDKIQTKVFPQSLVSQDELKRRFELLLRNPFELQVETEQDEPPSRTVDEPPSGTVKEPETHRSSDSTNEVIRPICALELRPREYIRYLEVRRQREQGSSIATDN